MQYTYYVIKYMQQYILYFVFEHTPPHGELIAHRPQRSTLEKPALVPALELTHRIKNMPTKKQQMLKPFFDTEFSKWLW